jgi:hypothetical protein
MRWLPLLLVLSACSDTVDNDIRAAVTLVANNEGAAEVAAEERLERHGRRAIPTIEAALHTAGVPGRKNLIATLRRIGDEEAVPLLRHVALYDGAPDVRREALWTLKQWGQGGGSRADKARAAVRSVEEQQRAEEHT